MKRSKFTDSQIMEALKMSMSFSISRYLKEFLSLMSILYPLII
jgi:hypothetical protein